MPRHRLSEGYGVHFPIAHKVVAKGTPPRRWRGVQKQQALRELFDMIKHAYSMASGKKVNAEAIHLTLHIEKEDTKQERRRKTKLALHKHKGNKNRASIEPRTQSTTR